MRESAIGRRVVAFLVRRGSWVTKIHGEAMQQRGLPDLLSCYKGRFVAIELKVPGEEPKPLQEWTLNQIRKAGGIVATVTSISEAKEVLERVDKMCAGTPIYAFHVTPDRMGKVDQLLAGLFTRVNQDQFMEIAVELGYENGLRFDNGRTTMEMTDLQKVALVAALSAAVEGGLQMTTSDKYRDPNNILDLA